MDEAKKAKEEELAKKLLAYDYIRLSFVDLNGLHLSKLVSTKHVHKIISGQCEMYAGMITFGPRMEVVDIPYIVQRKHINNHLKPDFSTLHPCPWAGYLNREALHRSAENVPHQRVGAVLCDMSWPEGDLMQAYPRVVVKRLLEELENKHGVTLMSAFEPEFRAFKPETIEPSCRNPRAPITEGTIPEPVPFTIGEDMYKTSLLSIYESFFMDLDKNMREAGVDIQDCSNENGSGQLECPLMPDYGIKPADQYFIFKQAVKEIALKHDIAISFMTTPFVEGSSSGCHFNHSLWKVDDKRNVFFSVVDQDRLSKLARYWIGGLLEHLPAMLAFCSPTINCYRRLHKKLAPDAINWDFNDRFVTIRVKNTDEKRTYIENRIPSSASCPYHVMAATIAAGMDGIERKLEPVAPGQKPVNGKATPTCRLLPNTFQEALHSLRADTLFVEKLGPDFVDWFCQVKQRGDFHSLGKVDITKDDQINLAYERHEYLKYM
ncbi:uncharacterized protein DEA37_0002092 [Paragonimus westermani]|uniref:Lengsin n=1 Tax=Paragonimus westermani TaxID=34504 RepID=A0A5J4NZT8_9TREM|nr:uncharacterized protein DEA37_0002092 [Paragonimus westermani]